MKKVFYLLLIIFILFLIFLKPITVFFLEKSLERSMKSDVEITSFEFYPLNLDATIKMNTFPQGIDVHAKYVGGLSLSPRSIGKFIITSTSFDGLVTVEYEHYIYNINVDSIDFKKLAQFLNDEKEIVQEGVVNGTAIYYKKKKVGSTNLKATEVVLHIPDIDQTIARVNDAINLNVINLFSRNLTKKQKNGGLTEVDHFQFDIDYKDKNITVRDVALRTDTYRVSLVSKLNREGDIDYFYIHLLDEKGCSVVKQELKENVKTPTRKTSASVGNVVQKTPTSFFNMGKQMMQYGSTYAGKQTGMNAPTKQMLSYVIKESDQMFKNTSKMMLKKKCKVIYNGKVKHPRKKVLKKSKKTIQPKKEIDNTYEDKIQENSQIKETDSENTSTFYRKELLL